MRVTQPTSFTQEGKCLPDLIVIYDRHVITTE